MLVLHTRDDVHDTFMTLPRHTRTREDEMQALAEALALGEKAGLERACCSTSWGRLPCSPSVKSPSLKMSGESSIPPPLASRSCTKILAWC